MPEQEQNNTIKAVLFDLDGTLLRGQMKDFISQYIQSLSAYCADRVKPKNLKKLYLESSMT